MQGYFGDKRSNPWHRIIPDIEKYWPRKEIGRLGETLLLIRAGVFAALDMLSLAVAVDTPVSEVLKVFVGESDWPAGKKAARSHCSRLAEQLIAKGELRFLLPSALKRDGFGYLLGPLEKAQWDEFCKAKPKIKRKKLDLTALEESILGSEFLASQGITESRIPEDDERVPALVEAYEHYVVEYEVNRTSRLPHWSETEQTTLNGSALEEPGRAKQKRQETHEPGSQTDQAELTDYVAQRTSTKRSQAKTKKRRKS